MKITEYSEVGFEKVYSKDEEGKIEEILFRLAEKDNAKLFTILDSARSEEVLAKLAEREVEYESLYKGREEEPLFRVAPFLVVCKKETKLMEWLTSEAWGKSIGMFFTSPDSFKNLFTHFQRFLLVKEEGGEELYFRFYDPRVLRVYLPTCTEEELKEFFGKANQFIMESEDGKSFVLFTKNSS
jgi:hypothetical protein